MSLLDIRKIVVQLEETHKEMGKSVSPFSRKVTVAAVINNPYAGQYIEDLEPLYDLGKEIGGLLAKRGVEALGVDPDEVEAYGKGAIIGLDGEIEHAAAVLHPRFGGPVRAAVGHGDDQRRHADRSQMFTEVSIAAYRRWSGAQRGEQTQ